MLRPVDIPVLLKLTLPGASELSFQRLAIDLHLSSSEVHGAYRRAGFSGFITNEAAKTVNRTALLEFLEHGLRYSFPAERGELSRGVPTAYAAEPLRNAFHQGPEPPPVWPHADGKLRGYSFAPLYKHAPAAALEDAKLYALLSLADALRDGRVRERKLAIDMLVERVS